MHARFRRRFFSGGDGEFVAVRPKHGGALLRNFAYQYRVSFHSLSFFLPGRRRKSFRSSLGTKNHFFPQKRRYENRRQKPIFFCTQPKVLRKWDTKHQNVLHVKAAVQKRGRCKAPPAQHLPFLDHFDGGGMGF